MRSIPFMCVRYTLHDSDAALAALAKALARKLAPPEWAKPKYNITLTNVVPVVAISGENAEEPEVRGMMWGFVAPFDREKEEMQMWPNAKAEKALTSPMWRSAVAKKRCLVPANGFYEWETVGKMKYPHLFTLPNEEPFAFAGIWSPATAKVPENFAILTTEPNAVVGRYHNRMPVMLQGKEMRRWLGSTPLPEEEFWSLTRPRDPAELVDREVNRYVNKSGNEGPECHGPPEARVTITKQQPPAPQLDLGL